MAGGVAAGIDLSQWFLLVMAFGSLFMAAGKRYAELQLAERTGAKIRKSLEYYTPTYLRFVWTLAEPEKNAQLSTPPITGSIDATAVIASATMPPSHIAATACRLSLASCSIFA